jgi:hypothetical protein
MSIAAAGPEAGPEVVPEAVPAAGQGHFPGRRGGSPCWDARAGNRCSYGRRGRRTRVRVDLRFVGRGVFWGRYPAGGCRSRRRSDVGGLLLGVEVRCRQSTVVGPVEGLRGYGLVYWMEDGDPGLGYMDAELRRIDRGPVVVPEVVEVAETGAGALFVGVGVVVVPVVPS